MASAGPFRPGANADDCTVEFTENSMNLNDTIFGSSSSYYNNVDSGFRFKSVTVPKDASISSAVVTFKAAASDSITTCRVRIQGEKNATPAIFTTYADYVDRLSNLTTAYTDWEPGAWTVDTEYDSPNIATMVEEIVALAGWSSGNDMVILFQNNGSDDGADRQPYQYESSSTLCARLNISYTEAAAGNPAYYYAQQ